MKQTAIEKKFTSIQMIEFANLFVENNKIGEYELNEYIENIKK
jgi:hypothetical protein